MIPCSPSKCLSLDHAVTAEQGRNRPPRCAVRASCAYRTRNPFGYRDLILEVSHGRRVTDPIGLVATELDAGPEAKEYERIEVEGPGGVLEIEI